VFNSNFITSSIGYTFTDVINIQAGTTYTLRFNITDDCRRYSSAGRGGDPGTYLGGIVYNTDGTSYLEGTIDYKFETYVTSGSSAPEMNVKQSATGIADGTGSYDFGNVLVGSPVTATFTIENKGDVALNLTDATRVAVSGTGFTLAADAAATVNANGTTTVQLTFTPNATGTFNGTVSIANNDANENPYNFAITGTGVASLPAITNALTFNGTSNYVSVGSAENLNLTTGTIEAWIKTPNAGASFRGIAVKAYAYGLFLIDGVLGVYD
jgi:hypothetical protein